MAFASKIDANELVSRCKAIELLVLDVDGVLTDGAIVIDGNGVESKNFYVRDGIALALWKRAGRKSAFLSGRRAACVDLRAAELGVDKVIQGAAHKLGPFHRLLAELGLEPKQVAFMGDDLVDVPILAEAGLAACPLDAVEEARSMAHLVSSKPGGRGAVRELIETILQEQGAWKALVEGFWDRS